MDKNRTEKFRHSSPFPENPLAREIERTDQIEHQLRDDVRRRSLRDSLRSRKSGKPRKSISRALTLRTNALTSFLSTFEPSDFIMCWKKTKIKITESSTQFCARSINRIKCTASCFVSNDDVDVNEGRKNTEQAKVELDGRRESSKASGIPKLFRETSSRSSITYIYMNRGVPKVNYILSLKCLRRITLNQL